MSDTLRPHGLQHTRPPCPSPMLKLMSIRSVMPSNHLILCRPLLLLPAIFPSIRVFSNESGPHIRWPKYWPFSFSISPSNEYSGLISFTGLISLLSSELSRVFSSTTVQKHQFFSVLSLLYSISPSSKYSGLIFFRMDWLDLLVVQGTLKSLLQHHSSKSSLTVFHCFPIYLP